MEARGRKCRLGRLLHSQLRWTGLILAREEIGAALLGLTVEASAARPVRKLLSGS